MHSSCSGTAALNGSPAFESNFTNRHWRAHWKVFIGTTVAGEAGAQDIHVFGDSVNVAARLAELAQAGEALITESAWRTAGLNVEHLSTRLIEMKGRTEPVSVIAIRDEPAITLH
jgi:class 3 adenylate cyclase